MRRRDHALGTGRFVLIRPGTLRRNRGEVGQLATFRRRAACLVELDGQFKGLMALRPRRRCMSAADFEQAHRQTERRSHRAVAADELNAGVPAVAADQFNGLPVGPAHFDCLAEYSHTLRPGNRLRTCPPAKLPAVWGHLDECRDPS